MKFIMTMILSIVGTLAIATAPKVEPAKLGTAPSPTMVVVLPNGDLVDACGASYDVTQADVPKCLVLRPCTILFNDGLESLNAAKGSPLCS